MTINRQREKEGLTKVNKKRIYRLMQICGLEAVIRCRPKRYRKVKPNYVAENILAKEGECPLLHSDRGYQYTSKAFKRILEKADMTHSMSRVGRCIDNGPIEAF